MHVDQTSVLLIGASIIVLVPFLLWWVLGLKRIFPLAVIQIFTGIALGPTLLGYWAPGVEDFLFSGKSLDGIKALASISVCLFAFLAGTEADRDVIADARGAVVAIGFGSLAVTWAAGAAAGYWLTGTSPGVMGTSQDPAVFAVAFGLCNAVPALPVLAAILNELGLNRRPIGAMTLAAAAIGDAILWASVAVILPFAAGSGGLLITMATAIGGALLATAFCLFVINPTLAHVTRNEAPERVLMILVGLAIFVSAAITQLAGLHGVLGAFLVGALLPDNVRHTAAAKLDMPTSLLLLPFFFLDTGLQARITLADPLIWTTFFVGITVCVMGKIIAAIICGWLAGASLAVATLCGILLQTKGLMELVIVTVFRQAGIVGPTSYAALVLVALASTALTMPLTKLLLWMAGDIEPGPTASRKV
ncbi:MAG: cation:proton antiporter [Proteobacteria bacterium]|nr:cation:proton antiporter [Pseudomonadota bacterium]